jgi:NAD(P)-dependent dehydrogenase (short-subunit alcohol dehydrogenase family)
MSGVLVVTGGSRGIGAAVSRLAARRGWKVAINYHRSADAAERLVRDIAAEGGTAIAIGADAGSSAGVAQLFAEVDARLGTVTGLVNNAGVIGGVARVDAADPATMTALFATNVLGYFYCAREAVRRMSTRHGGHGGVIVNISSAAARTGGLPGEVPYAATKGAIDALTVGLGKEVGTEGVRVVGIRPGLIVTDIHEMHGGQDTLDRLGPTVPIGRTGSPEEIAEAALFLLSDAASYITAVTIDVSGGR